MNILANVIARIEQLKAELEALRPLTHTAELRFRQKISLDWTFNSNAIEGNRLTFGETKTFIKHGITAAGKPFRDYIDVRGHTKAVKAVFELSGERRPLTEALIRQLHEITLVEPYRTPSQSHSGQKTTKLIQLGKYKTQPNHVQTSTGETHFYASPEETPAKMGDLMAWYRAEIEKTGDDALHPLFIASTFHYKFVAIHPFDDGNGRMARLLMNYILLSFDYPPAIIPTNKKGEYLTALEVADTGDLEPFILFVGRELLHSFDMYIRATKGENIEEYGDLDKKLILLQHKIKSDKIEVEKQKKDRLQTKRQFFQVIVRPFMEDLLRELSKFNTFFSESSTVSNRSLVGSGSSFSVANLSNPDRILSAIEQQIELDSRYDRYQCSIFWNRFKGTKALVLSRLQVDIFIHISRNEVQIDYSLDGMVGKGEHQKKTLLTQKYHVDIPVNQRRQLIAEVTSKVYKAIEAHS